MPDDPVFEPKPNGGGEPPKDPPPATSLSKEEVAAIVAEQVGPVQKSTEDMAKFLASLREQAPPTPPADSGSDKDWPTRFYEQPQETVQDEIASQTAPALQAAASTMGKMLLDQQKASVDKEFGAGAWDEVFKDRLDPVVADAAKSNPMSLMSPTAVQNAVDTIKGNNFATLAVRAQKLAEAANEDPNKELRETVKNQVVQELSGGIRRIQPEGGHDLKDEESQEYLATLFRETGAKPDQERIGKLVGVGDTYSDWKAATKEKE